MTATEKIIAKHCKNSKIRTGQIVYIDVDYCMTNDATINFVIELFENKIGADSLWDPDRVILIKDHQVPSNSIDTANAHKRMDDFAGKFGVKNIYHAEGVCHQVMYERHVKPGTLIVGADSHTCSYGFMGCLSIGIGSTDCAAVWASGKMWMKVPETYKFRLNGVMPLGVYSKDLILRIIGEISAEGANYKCMEFQGEAIDAMSLSERFTVANMTVEAGAKCSLMIPDKKVIDYLMQKGIADNYSIITPDEDAIYAKEFHYNVSDLVPQIACPYSVDNVKSVPQIEGLKIDEAFIGSCTNGRIEDLRVAAQIFKGRKIANGIRLLITPASRKIYREAIEEGLIDIFIDAGAIINHPNCSVCWGACQGVIGNGERLISSANRNFRGRAGSSNSEIYLASPATVAASAIEGKIADPRGYIFSKQDTFFDS